MAGIFDLGLEKRVVEDTEDGVESKVVPRNQSLWRVMIGDGASMTVSDQPHCLLPIALLPHLR